MGTVTPPGTFARLMARAAEPAGEANRQRHAGARVPTHAATDTPTHAPTHVGTHVGTHSATDAPTGTATPPSTLPGDHGITHEATCAPATVATTAAAHDGAQSPLSTPAPAATLAQSQERAFAPTRAKRRHTFDMFDDQLWALDDLQRAIWRRNGQKPTLSALLQEALDRYLHDMTGETLA
jgi:hypothetical protein